jgi:hypothetical protein
MNSCADRLNSLAVKYQVRIPAWFRIIVGFGTGWSLGLTVGQLPVFTTGCLVRYLVEAVALNNLRNVHGSGGPGSIPGTIKKSSGSGTGSTQPREYN